MKMESLVTARTYEEQEVVFLALELCNVLETILQQQGWKPTSTELTRLEKAVVNYVISYREEMKDLYGGWSVVLGNYTLKRVFEKKRGKKRNYNKTKKSIERVKKTFFNTLKEIGVMELFKKAPVFSIVISSNIHEREHLTGKSEFTRKNCVKYSYGYGSDHKKVFFEEIPL